MWLMTVWCHSSISWCLRLHPKHKTRDHPSPMSKSGLGWRLCCMKDFPLLLPVRYRQDKQPPAAIQINLIVSNTKWCFKYISFAYWEKCLSLLNMEITSGKLFIISVSKYQRLPGAFGKINCDIAIFLTSPYIMWSAKFNPILHLMVPGRMKRWC